MLEELIKGFEPKKTVADAGYKGRHTERDFKKVLDAARMIDSVLRGTGIEVVLRETQPKDEIEK